MGINWRCFGCFGKTKHKSLKRHKAVARWWMLHKMWTSLCHGWIYWCVFIPFLDALLTGCWTAICEICSCWFYWTFQCVLEGVKTSPGPKLKLWESQMWLHLRCASPCGQPNNVGLGWVKAAHGLQLPQLYLLLRPSLPTSLPPLVPAQACECNEYPAFMCRVPAESGNQIVH